MSELKITIDQLKNYLGTGLKFHYQGEMDDATGKPIKFELKGVSEDGWVDGSGKLETIEDSYHIDDMFLICYRLSDLDKEIEVNGERFVPLDELPNIIEGWCDAYEEYFNIGFDGTSLDGCPFEVVQKLLEWGFWIGGDIYFSERLVIDKMRVK